MTKAGPQLADLGLDVRDYLDGSEARQMALRQRIWKDRSAKGPVLSKNPFRFPLKAPNGDYAAIVIPEGNGGVPNTPGHLQPFRESEFVNTTTHTMFTLFPPDGGSKPSIKTQSDQSPVKYRGTMLSDTSNRLPAEIVMKQDTRLAHVFKPPKEYIPGPGEVPWENALGGQSLGPYYHSTKSSVSRSPGRDPNRLSQPFLAKQRPDPTSLIFSAAPDQVYSPAAPNFESWTSSGFATSSNLRDIKAETWGRNPREPRDPHAVPGPKEFPVLGKCGHPYDISAQARPQNNTAAAASEMQPARKAVSPEALLRQQRASRSRGVHTAPASPSYGRQNITNLGRHPGREIRPGTRSTVQCPYTRPEEMGPGSSFPLVKFNAPAHLACGPNPERNSPRVDQFRPKVHVQAVREVQRLRWEIQQQEMHAQFAAAQSRSQSFDNPTYHTERQVPADVLRLEVLRRVGLCTA